MVTKGHTYLNKPTVVCFLSMCDFLLPPDIKGLKQFVSEPTQETKVISTPVDHYLPDIVPQSCMTESGLISFEVIYCTGQAIYLK